PRAQDPIPKWQPFNLWHCQEELVEFILRRYERNETGGVKKSRDMGFSWACAAIAVWVWLFVPASAVTFGSRKEKLVDNLGDLDALLPKVRAIIEGLPGWMTPEGYTRSSHAHYMRIRNPETGSIIRGEVGDEMGRGGRSTIYFADEFAFLPRADQARGAIGGNSDVAIYGSTSNGVGTCFYRMEASGAIPFHYLHWRDHPRRGDDWKRKKVGEIGRANFAREYDMDDGAALEDIIIPSNWVQSAVDLELPLDGLRTAGLDVGGRGADDNAYASRLGPVLRRIVAWDEPNTTQTARKALELACEDAA
ncbi:MAG: TerL protein, partial [Bradymonadaceae bacterium]